TMDISLVDEVIKISDDEAIWASRFLAQKEGIFAGSSSGAALAASIKLSKTIDHGNIVTIFPDRGDRYLSKGLYE
ncbi:MAG: pyridoxal-phosphate dependent enzyme, partial [Eubacterium sp.]|nr:pyridoxal-phosphate dependent enzyme [Eubacterium sp.]